MSSPLPILDEERENHDTKTRPCGTPPTLGLFTIRFPVRAGFEKFKYETLEEGN
jgi:hypothetical protein